MKKRKVLVLGSGKRVQQAVLPALARAPELFELQGVLARTRKTVTAGGREYAVEPFADLPRAEIEAADLIIACVAKTAAPTVLRQLVKADLETTDLLIDTPVLLFKQMGHLGLLDAFRNVWVAEDCTTLPAFDAVKAFLALGEQDPGIGELREIVWMRASYAYHGIAMAKALFGHVPVSRASRTRWHGPYAERVLRFGGSRTLRVIEPRDYATANWLFLGTHGALADYPAKDHHLLEAVLDEGRLTGFRIGDVATRLDDNELELVQVDQSASGTTGSPTGTGVARWMEGMKRVGLLRLLRQIAAGEGAYPLGQAIDDTVCDYHLEKFGQYVANPLTSPRFGTARVALRALTKLSGN